MNLRNAIILSTLAAAIAITGCKKPAPAPAPAPPAALPAPTMAPTPVPAVVGVRVTGIDLGSGIGADQRVTATKTVFMPTETIYAVVNTSGSASSTALSAKWTFQDGQTVNESAQTIAPTGAAATAFQVNKPDGWPVGKYKVEIMMDGMSAGSREFEVK